MNKKIFAVAFLGPLMLSALGCVLITHEKKIMDPPWVPPVVIGDENVSTEPPVGEVCPVYFSKTDVPTIDGDFSEWKNLEGAHARVMVYGGRFNSKNSAGDFVVRTNGTHLFLYASVTDDYPEVNKFPSAQAWRGDSIEFFFGTDTSRHTFYKPTDKRVRIFSKSKDSVFQTEVSINDAAVRSAEVKAACAYSKNGYQIEAVIPLSLFNQKPLKLKQKVRLEFQVNDADEGKERSRLQHWMSSKDASYMDTSTWGDGKVVALPEITQGE